jgi:hypothetical protein
VRGMAVQAMLKGTSVNDALREAALAVGAARPSGNTARLVDSMATHATVMLRAAAEGGDGVSSGPQLQVAARGLLEEAIGLCAHEKRRTSEQVVRLEGAHDANGHGTALAAVLRCPLISAEAVSRSALGRALYATGDARGAVQQLRQAVELRRENLRLRADVVGEREPNHAAVLAEAQRQLASTLINFGGVLQAESDAYGPDGARAATTRAVLGEALTLARLSGDVGTEQGALTQLVNFNQGGAGGGEHRDAASALKELLARTGRAVDASCSVCLEELGESNLQALNCGHVMHKECAERWFQHSNACPQCKRAMTG